MTALPVVLVHGVRLTGAMWQPHVAHIGQTRQVRAPDLPGHGIRKQRRFTIESAVETVREAIDEVGGRAVVAGASMGGYVAIAAAASYPDKVAGLVAMSCTAELDARSVRPGRILARMDGPRWDAWQRRVFHLMMGRSVADRLASAGFHNRAVPDVLDALGRFDPAAALRTYPGPVRFLNGRWDHFRVNESRFLKACADASLTVVPKAGHLVSLSQPDKVSDIVEQFAAAADSVKPSNASSTLHRHPNP